MIATIMQTHGGAICAAVIILTFATIGWVNDEIERRRRNAKRKSSSES